MEFYRQLGVLNPNNLPLMSSALADYSALRLEGCDEDFTQYLQSTKRDIDGAEELVEWWKTHRPSVFRERVLFLITSPVTTGSVERFFSLCGQLDADQWALSQNTRRLEFMLQFNGDLSGRFTSA